MILTTATGVIWKLRIVNLSAEVTVTPNLFFFYVIDCVFK